MEETRKKIISIVEDVIMDKIETSETMDVSFENLGLDSFLFVRVLVEIENEFDIQFESDSFEDGIFENLNSLVFWVQNKINE